MPVLYKLYKTSSNTTTNILFIIINVSTEEAHLHPITYMSGLFCDSQIYGTALTKEAHAIYISVKS